MEPAAGSGGVAVAGAAPSRLVSGATARPPSAPTEPPWVRRLLIAVALGFLGLFVVVPIAVVIDQALSQGLGVYRRAVTDPAARDAIALTLKVAAIAVPLNLVFGVAAAWAIAHFRFRGRALLLTLIDLPFAGELSV